MNSRFKRSSLIWTGEATLCLGRCAKTLLLGLRSASVLIILAGCTQYWAKPGGTPAEFEATKAGCQAQSYAQFPPMPEQVMLVGGYTTPLQTSCTGAGFAVNCLTTGGQYVPPTYITVDRNESARGSGFKACLFSAGWRPVKDKEEAAAVTQSGGIGASQPAATPASVSGEATQRAVQYCDDIFKVRQEPGMMAVFGNSYEQCFQKRARELAGVH